MCLKIPKVQVFSRLRLYSIHRLRNFQTSGGPFVLFISWTKNVIEIYLASPHTPRPNASEEENVVWGCSTAVRDTVLSLGQPQNIKVRVACYGQ